MILENFFVFVLFIAFCLLVYWVYDWYNPLYGKRGAKPMDLSDRKNQNFIGFLLWAALRFDL